MKVFKHSKFKITFLIFNLFIALNCPLYAEDTKNSNEINSLIQEGVSKFNSKDYPNAIIDFRKALKLSPNNAELKKYLAISLNNYALLIAKEDKTDEAILNLEESLRLFEDGVARKNLAGILLEKAINLYNRHELNSALVYSKKSLNVHKDNFEVLKLAGNICYELERLDEAISYYSTAESLKPDDVDLARTLEKLKNEKAVKKTFRDMSSARFIIKYESKSQDFDFYQFRPILDEAYRIIGQDLNLFPAQQLVVIIYSEESYKKLKNQPAMVTGLFDGKIHIPLRSDVKDIKEYKVVVYHEYTHALIFSITMGNCPIWLNEGFAEYEESRIKPIDLRILKTALKTNSLIGISSLDGVFSLIKSGREPSQKEQELLTLAYEESYTIAKYLLHRFTRAHIQRLFNRLKKGIALNEALKSELYLSTEQLQKQWLEYLRQNY